MEMKPLEEIYPPRFFARRDRLHWRAPILAREIGAVLFPKDVIDVGCATGDLVAAWLNLGVSAEGIEGSRAVRPFLVIDMSRITFRDLREPLPNPPEFSLATCFEVAEHIENEHAGALVDNLCALSPRVLASFAPPGQGGHYHVNCQPLSYWSEMFADRGYSEARKVSDEIKRRLALWRHKPGIKAIWQNLAYFERAPF